MIAIVVIIKELAKNFRQQSGSVQDTLLAMCSSGSPPLISKYEKPAALYGHKKQKIPQESLFNPGRKMQEVTMKPTTKTLPPFQVIIPYLRIVTSEYLITELAWLYANKWPKL